MPKFLTRYTQRVRQSLTFDPSTSLTMQSFRDTSDINHIVARYVDNSIPMPQAQTGSTRKAFYVDGVTMDGDDFRRTQDKLIAAERLFASQPAPVRDYFNHDAASFLDAAYNNQGQSFSVYVRSGGGVRQDTYTFPVLAKTSTDDLAN